jgi:DNA-binding NarL/FixJ family response regulator
VDRPGSLGSPRAAGDESAVSSFNILIAEDFALFREFASRELERRSDFRVVAVSDGLAAVQKAEDLQPDLILLDIGLPKLDGLAAARRIRPLCPKSSIVFLTQESALDVVQEALSLGPHGYIDKTCARYLLPAVEAILEGRPAVGRSVPAADPERRTRLRHRSHFYSDDATLLETGERFLGSALAAHDGAIAIVTRPHRELLLTRLKNCGSHIERAIERGSLVCLDADELAAQVLADGVAHWQPFLVRTIESAAAATMRPLPRIAVFGECASVLWAAGHVEMACGLEQVAIEVARTMSVDIICPYPLRHANPGNGFKTVCAQHGVVTIR